MMKRRNNDAYFTPEWAIKALLERVDVTGKVLEPCAGSHVITNVLRENKNITEVVTNDISVEYSQDHYTDACNKTIYSTNKYDWIITNPPFNKALEIVRNSVESGSSVAMLLRISFLEPTFDRSEFLDKNAPDYMLVLPRISFTGDGKTDSATCAWMMWYKDRHQEGFSNPLGIEVVPKTK